MQHFIIHFLRGYSIISPVKTSPFVTVILCGGGGARLWPLSRAEYAKPFVKLPGLAAPLIEETYRRLPDGHCKAVLTVTAAGNIFLCREAAERQCQNSELLFIGEPAGRNTAPAIAAAARWVSEKYGNDIPVIVLPADHLVGNPDAFWNAADNALTAATSGFALLGIKPDHPATGYGYIEYGTQLDNGCLEVKRFVEKPDADTAAQFLSAGNFLWNAGVFCFTPKVLFDEMQKHAPEMLFMTAALKPSETNEWLPTAEEYNAFPDISFDYALMEKTDNAAVAAAEGAQWSDVGSWAGLAEHIPADSNGNRTPGLDGEKTLLVDSSNCFIAGDNERLIAALGLDNLHIIDTPDALLVADGKRSQEVRKLYDTLRERNSPEAKIPLTVHRPWGSYTVLAESPGHKVKRITVKPGGILSLQSHRHRSEHWTTIDGVMSVVIEDKEFDMAVDESCHIPLGAKHRMLNKTDVAASIIEVQIGDYLGEDDIIRYEDAYGRLPEDKS